MTPLVLTNKPNCRHGFIYTDLRLADKEYDRLLFY